MEYYYYEGKDKKLIIFIWNNIQSLFTLNIEFALSRVIKFLVELSRLYILTAKAWFSFKT